MNIYEYRTKLLARPMTMPEIQRAYQNSVLAKTTRLAKECKAWYDPEYTESENVKNHISECGSSQVYTKKIQEYWKTLDLAK